VGNLAAGPARRGLLAWEGQVAFDTLVSSGTAYIDAGHSADDRYDPTALGAAERF